MRQFLRIVTPGRFARTATTLAGCGLLIGLLQALPAQAADEPAPPGANLEIALTPTELLGPEDAARLAGILPPDETLRWQVYRPDSGSTAPPGLLVYVSPDASGRIDSHWRRVLDERNLAFVAAHRSGNRMPVDRRMVLALLAPRVVAGRFAFDRDRVWIAGYSGGGRVASRLAPRYPNAFRGALYICGVDPLPDADAFDPALLRDGRFVFLSGARDFNREETRRVYREYRNAGIVHSRLMVIPGMGHELPAAPDLTEALRFLDGEGADASPGGH
ncbi:MAG: hypothetical protein P8Y54_04535 [Xanthomonadales bacterium]